MNKDNTHRNLLNELPPPPAGKTGWPWTEETNPEIYNDLNYQPRISIVTPTFNQGEYIEETIRSILLQNYPDTEYIIIDGGSTDNTNEIIQKYKKWISYSVSEKDKGQTEAINKGVKKCTGEIFNWINSDDYYCRDCFKNLMKNFTDKNTYIVTGAYRFYSDNGNSADKYIKTKLRSSVEETIADVPINQSPTFFRFDILKSLGELDEELEFVMDQDIWIKYLFRYGQENIRVIDDILCNFRIHEKSKTSNNSFVTEYNRIYYSIALMAGMKRHSETINNYYENIEGKKFEFKFKLSETDKIIAARMLNYYLLLRAKKSLTENNIDMLNKILPVIEPENLNDINRAVLKKLKIKSKMHKYKLAFLLKA